MIGRWTKSSMVLGTILVGAVVGISIGVFRVLIFRVGTWMPLAVWEHAAHAVLLGITAYVVLGVMKSHPGARGSGLPQLKAAIRGKMDLSQKGLLGIRYISMVCLNTLGLAVGSAGPAVELGACTADMVGRFMESKNPSERTGRRNPFWLKVGAACGLAAFLGTPLTALAFTYEEFDLEPTFEKGIRTVAAVFISFSVASVIAGKGPILSGFMSNRAGITDSIYPEMIRDVFGLSLACIIVGVVFKRLLFRVGRWFDSDIKCLIPYFLAFGAAYLQPIAMGGGMLAIKNGVSIMGTAGSDAGYMLMSLLAIRFIFILSCSGTGMPAGLVFPIVSTGALLGMIFHGGTVLIPLGISMLFAVIMRRPVTSILLGIELTGAFQWVLIILPIVLVVEWLLSRAGDRPLNDMLLEKLTDADPDSDF